MNNYSHMLRNDFWSTTDCIYRGVIPHNPGVEAAGPSRCVSALCDAYTMMKSLNDAFLRMYLCR